MKRPEAAATAVAGTAGHAPAVAWRFFPPLAVFCLALASFWPSTGQGFVALDDDRNFEPAMTPLLGQFSEEGWRWMWTSYHIGHWQPLSWISLSIDVALFGRDGGAIHRTNVVLHALGALATWFAALALLRAGFARSRAAASPGFELALRGGATFAASLWALHPLRVESVAWATERRDVLSALFLLASLLAYSRRVASQRHRAAWLALSLAFYVLSLMSKAWGMTYPVLLFAIDLYPLRRHLRGERIGALALEKLAYVPFAVGCAVIAAQAQRFGYAVVPLAEHGVWARLAQACYGLSFYVWKTLWPSDLSCLYLLELDFSPTQPVYLACQALVAASVAALVLFRKRFPAGAAAFFAYALLASPVLGFLQSGTQKVADRYTYLAALPLAVLAAAGLVALLARGAAPRWIGLALGLAPALALVPASRAQTRVWKDSITLFEHALEVEPHNYFVAHNLATMLYRDGRYAAALEVEARSVAAHPGKGNEEARYTLGLLHQQLGDAEAAERAWRAALDVAPDHRGSLEALVRALQRRGEAAAAHAALEAVLERAPRNVFAYGLLAEIELARGRPDAALELWRRHARATLPADAVAALEAAVSALPWDARSRNELGRALIAAGRDAEAIPHLEAAVRAESKSLELVSDLGLGYALTGNATEALRCAEWVLQTAPDDPRARSLVAIARARAPR